jgi:hypothetical protein
VYDAYTTTQPPVTLVDFGIAGRVFTIPEGYTLNGGEVWWGLYPDYSIREGDSMTSELVFPNSWLTGTAGQASRFEARWTVTGYIGGGSAPIFHPATSAPNAWHVGGLYIGMCCRNPLLAPPPSVAGCNPTTYVVTIEVTVREIANPANVVVVPGEIGVWYGAM